MATGPDCVLVLSAVIHCRHTAVSKFSFSYVAIRDARGMEVGEIVSALVPRLFSAHAMLMYSWFCFMAICSVNTTLRRMEVISGALRTGCFRLPGLKMTNGDVFFLHEH